MKITVFCLLLLMISACTIKRQKEGVATYLGHHSYVRGGSDYWEFYDNGKQYKILEGASAYIVPGEKCVLVYDSLQHDINYLVDGTRPVFISGEVTKKTFGIIITDHVCITPKSFKDIEFEYHVNGRYYNTCRTMPERKDTLCVKRGDKFEVEYWQENPKRVIIYIDKPIK